MRRVSAALHRWRGSLVKERRRVTRQMSVGYGALSYSEQLMRVVASAHA